MEESNPYRYQHHRVQTGSPTTERHLPETKKPRRSRVLMIGFVQALYATIESIQDNFMQSQH